jgi:hypothetical protein
MVNEYYRFTDEQNHTLFSFESEGQQGKILKVVLFTLDDDNRWNLGFGDWHNGYVNDTIISNNHDVTKVIGTISRIVYTFFEEYPDRVIFIQPVDERRKRLYNIVFQRHILEIETDFEIMGFIGKKTEMYSNKKNYDAFEIKLKP